MGYKVGEGLKVLVIYPDVAEAIAERRKQLELQPIETDPLSFGQDETMEIVNLLRARLLSGRKATIGGLLDILQEGWDIIWLITHGEEAGWYLTDGLVNVSEMTTLIRSSGTFLTVMNTCSSYEVASKAAEELGTAFICTLSEVPDRQAFITGVIFAQKLAQGYDYVRAYQLAAPGQTHPYVLIEAKDPMMPQDRHQPYQPGQSLDPETLTRLLKTVEDVDLILNGSVRLGLPSLRDVVKQMQSDMKLIKSQFGEIQSQLSNIQGKQRSRNVTLFGLVLAIIVLVAIIIVLSLRIGGFV